MPGTFSSVAPTSCDRNTELRSGPVSDPPSVSDHVDSRTRSDRPPVVFDPPVPIDTAVPPPNYLGPTVAVTTHQLQQLVNCLASLRIEPGRDASLNLTSAGCSVSSVSASTLPSSSDSTQHPDLDSALEDLKQRLAVPPSLSHTQPREVVPASLSAYAGMGSPSRDSQETASCRESVSTAPVTKALDDTTLFILGLPTDSVSSTDVLHPAVTDTWKPWVRQ